jgi:hypothetical protein
MVNSNGNRQKRKRSDDRKHYSPFTIYHLRTKKRSTAALLSSSPPVQLTCPFYDPGQKSSFAKLPFYLEGAGAGLEGAGAGAWTLTSIFCVPPPPNNRPLKTKAKAKSTSTKITRTATTPALPPPPPSPFSPITRPPPVCLGGTWSN